ncbi:MAG: DNA-binding domain-containing protein [Myxococcota bacterium]|nr:DNA-binding domain-containing protein [Myxococcota bacterium]
MSAQETLPELQAWFMRAVTAGVEVEAEAHLGGPPRFPAHEGLAVYANAYVARLVECLAESFPVVARVLGEEAFGALAADYLRACPPSSPNLSNLGAGFSRHLDATRPVDAEGWGECLVSLARYERAIEEVFDGPGPEAGAALTLADLHGLDPGAWAASRLLPNPALRLLRLGES